MEFAPVSCAVWQPRAVPTALVLIADADHENILKRLYRLAARAKIILDWCSRHDGLAAPPPVR